ncbi:hypothetical protein Mia14_0899 [Candidatus Mancarchaeum acidiphilum]|uniref:Transcriptional regulator n=2 Tax=Candidatus Mancarchaeum acidiphilum TaxID=1920749 RepID=A0A218NNW8_9ARCH|nr:hypothetical protein Mia14_0899 [Candidatus Mancarchaeum acidiphilum]
MLIHMIIMELTGREKNVCGIICGSERIRFTDIKKRSGLHQEILSRILRRIKDSCDILRLEGGYKCIEVDHNDLCKYKKS